MIQLQVDFTLLNKYFGIPLSKISQYANMDIEEIMEAEAAQGNTKAEDYDEILSDPDKLLEIFKLANIENRYIILQNMSEGDLDDLLPFLEHDSLVSGLNYFTEEKLMEMCEDLPIEEIVGMIFEKFDLFDVLSLMDDDSMNTFIMQPDVERKYAQTYFESLDRTTLENIMVYSFGEEQEGKTIEEYLEYLEELNDDDYKNFLTSMEREQKMNLINGMASQEEDLLLLFEASDLIAPMNLLMKTDKIKLMSNLDDEFIIPMIQELPMDLTQVVLTQIDPRVFSEILAEDFQDILSSVVLFSTRAA